MDPDSTLTTILIVAAVLAVNAVFVITEFSLLTLRRGRLEQAAREGDARASRALVRLGRADELSLIAQLGRSASTLALGWVALVVGLEMLGRGPVSMGAAIAIALAVTAVVHALIAEQLPKLVGVQRAEWAVFTLVAGPLYWLSLVLRPITWVLTRLLQGLARMLRLSFPGLHPLAHTPEEIQILVAQGHEQGVVEEDEREMIHGVFEFSDTVAREVMTPRIDIVAVPVDITLPELIRVLVEEGHSRLPVFDGTIDSVVGVLLAKDLLPLLADTGELATAPFDVRRVMREPYFVPDTKPVDDILAEFRQQSVHLAIVVDEFGGTYGLLTMEDLLEEIVGDINDEYDVAEPDFTPTPEGDVLIDGGAALSDVNERYALALPEDDYDTIGGYIFGTLGRVPEPGDEVAVGGAGQDFVLQVEEIEDRRVLLVRLREEPAEEVAAE